MRSLDKPLSISVVVPAYNIAPYIGDALESALKQDPPFEKIIVIDDGSTDATPDIILAFQNPRIIYHRQDNQGLGPTRNVGIQLASSDYVYFMDGDDVLADGMTRFVQDKLSNYDETPDAIFFSAIDFHHQSGEKLPSSRYFTWSRPGEYESGRHALISEISSKRIPACVFLGVFSRAIVGGENPLRFKNILHEDELFTPALMLRCRRTILTNQVLYHRRVRPGSIMSSRPSQSNVVGYVAAARQWADFADGVAPDESRLFLRQSALFYREAILRAVSAKIGPVKTRHLIETGIEKSSKFVHFDYAVGKASKKLARYLIAIRTRAFLFFFT